MFTSKKKNDNIMFSLIESNNMSELKNCIDAGGDVNATRNHTYLNRATKFKATVKNETLLHFAVIMRNAEALDLLLKSGRVKKEMTAIYVEHSNDTPMTAYDILDMRCTCHPEDEQLKACMNVFVKQPREKSAKELAEVKQAEERFDELLTQAASLTSQASSSAHRKPK